MFLITTIGMFIYILCLTNIRTRKDISQHTCDKYIYLFLNKKSLAYHIINVFSQTHVRTHDPYKRRKLLDYTFKNGVFVFNT